MKTSNSETQLILFSNLKNPYSFCLGNINIRFIMDEKSSCCICSLQLINSKHFLTLCKHIINWILFLTSYQWLKIFQQSTQAKMKNLKYIPWSVGLPVWILYTLYTWMALEQNLFILPNASTTISYWFDVKYPCDRDTENVCSCICIWTAETCLSPLFFLC